MSNRLAFNSPYPLRGCASAGGRVSKTIFQKVGSGKLNINDAVELTSVNLTSQSPSFSRKLSSLGCNGLYPSNMERDFVRLARTQLRLRMDLAHCKTLTRDPSSVVKDSELGMILPHEFAHNLFEQNSQKFRQLLGLDAAHEYWTKTIALAEPWFTQHPLASDITAAEDRSKFVPIVIFGDDGTLRKSRAFSTITWHSGLWTTDISLHTRFPVFLVAKHVLVPGVTERDLQTQLVWY